MREWVIGFDKKERRWVRSTQVLCKFFFAVFEHFMVQSLNKSPYQSVKWNKKHKPLLFAAIQFNFGRWKLFKIYILKLFGKYQWNSICVNNVLKFSKMFVKIDHFFQPESTIFNFVWIIIKSLVFLKKLRRIDKIKSETFWEFL